MDSLEWLIKCPLLVLGGLLGYAEYDTASGTEKYLGHCYKLEHFS